MAWWMAHLRLGEAVLSDLPIREGLDEAMYYAGCVAPDCGRRVERPGQRAVYMPGRPATHWVDSNDKWDEPIHFERFYDQYLRVPSVYKGQYAWRGLKAARTVFSSSTCHQQAFVLRPCPRRFQFPGRSEGVFRLRAAFRARIDDEALLGGKARRKTQTWTWPAPENRVAPCTLRANQGDEPPRRAFCWGYYVHLLTDALWIELGMRAFIGRGGEWNRDLRRRMKRDALAWEQGFYRAHPDYPPLQKLEGVHRLGFDPMGLPEALILSRLQGVRPAYEGERVEAQIIAPEEYERALDQMIHLARMVIRGK